jgi:hypothetical protein
MVNGVCPGLATPLMSPRHLLLLSLCALSSTLPAQAPRAGGWPEESAAIERVIHEMQGAWNRGDLQGFQNPGVVFVSKGRFQRDWQGTLDHYIADYGASGDSRGTLCFYDIRIQPLAADAAQLISRYRLLRAEQPQYGINTRLMRKIEGRWVIALNHVSAVDTPDPTDTAMHAACDGKAAKHD